MSEIQERLHYFIPPHPMLIVEYYNKKFGLKDRKRLFETDVPDQESVYVYLRSKKPIQCDLCLQKATRILEK